jgi:hypothetical protein
MIDFLLYINILIVLNYLYDILYNKKLNKLINMTNYNDVIKNFQEALEIAMRPTLRKNKILYIMI